MASNSVADFFSPRQVYQTSRAFLDRRGKTPAKFPQSCSHLAEVIPNDRLSASSFCKSRSLCSLICTSACQIHYCLSLRRVTALRTCLHFFLSLATNRWGDVSRCLHCFFLCRRTDGDDKPPPPPPPTTTTSPPPLPPLPPPPPSS